MSGSTTRRPFHIGEAATKVLRNKLGPDFTKEMVNAYDLEELAETLDCAQGVYEEILWWSYHPGLSEYVDRGFTPEEQEVENLTRELTFRSIGYFIFGFSTLEFNLRNFLGLKIKLDGEYFSAVLTHDFALLCTAILEVYRMSLDGETYTRLRKLIGRAREFNDLRVKVVHGAWIVGSDGGTLRYVARGNLQDFYSNDMANHLEEQTNQMRGVVGELIGIFCDDLDREKESDEHAP